MCASYSSDVTLTWWRHQMETFSALLALCVGNSPVSGEFPAQRPVTWSFDVFFDLRLIKRLSKHSRGWWFDTLSRPLWRHCNEKPSLVTMVKWVPDGTKPFSEPVLTWSSKVCVLWHSSDSDFRSRADLIHSISSEITLLKSLSHLLGVNEFSLESVYINSTYENELLERMTFPKYVVIHFITS